MEKIGSLLWVLSEVTLCPQYVHQIHTESQKYSSIVYPNNSMIRCVLQGNGDNLEMCLDVLSSDWLLNPQFNLIKPKVCHI